jgi:hypothetical protein
MSKKIKIKINEQQYLNIVNRLSENIGLDDTFFNITPNETIVLKDENDIELKLKFIKNINDDYFFKDMNDLDVKISKNDFNKLNNELTINTVNPTTKMFVPKNIKVKSFEKFNDEENDETDGETPNDDVLFGRYYQDIMNDTNVEKAFYTAPSLWNYFTSALKNEKARGTGIYPAYKLINSYFNNKIKDKLPGFTDKENKRASFIINDNVLIYYKTIKDDKKQEPFILSKDGQVRTARVLQYQAGLGDVKLLSYKSPGGSYGYKIAVKKPTGSKQNEYLCDVYVNMNNVEENKYKQQNVKIIFLDSEGYKSTNTKEKNK